MDGGETETARGTVGNLVGVIGPLLAAGGVVYSLTVPSAVYGRAAHENLPKLLSLIPFVIASIGALITLIRIMLTRRWRELGFLMMALGVVMIHIGLRATDLQHLTFCSTVLIGLGGLVLTVTGTRVSVAQPYHGLGSRWLPLMLYLAIFAVGAAVRLYALDAYPQHAMSDEEVNTCMVLEFHTGRPYQSTVQAKEFLFFLLGDYWMYLTGSRLIALRALAALIGIATIPLVYIFTWQLFGEMSGLLAALFFALSPWHVVTSRYAERQSLALLFIPLVYSLWWSALTRVSIVLMAIAGFATGLGFHTWATYKIAPVVVVVLALYFFKKQSRRRVRMALGFVVALVMFASGLVGPAIITKDMRHIRFSVLGEIGESKMPQSAWQVVKNAGVMVFAVCGRAVGDSYYFQEYGLEHPGVVTLFLAGLGYCIISCRNRRRRLLIVLVVIHGLPSVLSDYPYQRRLQGIVFPFVILAGYMTARWLAALQLSPRATGLLLSLVAGLWLFNGFQVAWQAATTVRGERPVVNERVEDAISTRSIVLENEEFLDDWIRVAGWERTRDPYAMWWTRIESSLPLMIRDDRDASYFCLAKSKDRVLPLLEAVYPRLEVDTFFGLAGAPQGYEVKIPRQELQMGRQIGVTAPHWQPGMSLTVTQKHFLPVDLREYATSWNHGEAWQLNLDKPFYANMGDLRIDDLAAGLALVHDVPFYLMARSAVIFDSVFWHGKHRLNTYCRIALRTSTPVKAVHVLGLTSATVQPQLKPSVLLELDRSDRTRLELPLYTRAFRLQARTMRTPPYPTTLALQSRDTFLDQASFPVPPGAPVDMIELASVNHFESLAIVGLTLELSADGEKP